MTTKKGLFLSVEGIDGSGKSTHLEFIKLYLEKHGYQVIITREPGGTKTGEEIRELLLHSEHLQDNTELFLYFASRQELISKVILPNLAKGICVIADRFIDSSIAYQGAGRKLGVAKIKQISAMLDPNIEPALTLLFDADLAVAMHRLKTERKLDRIEKEPIEFFNTVQQAYYALLNENSQRIKLISTNVSIAETEQNLLVYLNEFMKNA